MSTDHEGAPEPGAPSAVRRLLTALALIAAVFFALAAIGSPLLGRTVFAGTDELARFSPYADAGLAGIQVQNTYLDDTYNSELPAELLFTDEARWGEFAEWNPYIAGGTPLGAVPNYALLSPLTLPFYVLPGWLAPAYQKLLELAVAMLGCALFLRRLRLSPAAATLGGIVFASSAFLVMWTNWPQTRVAALIGWVFWAIERLVQRRTVTDGVLLALPTGFMLLGGFPAVTAFALLTALPYLLVRAVAEHGRRPRRLFGVLLGALGALAGGVALAAVQLVPFAYFYRTWLIEGRAQTGADHLGLAELATSFAPWTFGGVSTRTDQPSWYLAQNMVEASSYVGAAALVLIVVCLAAPRAGRVMLPRGAWTYLVVASLSWLVLIYSGWPLSLLQRLPVFDANFIGRARSVLGFLLAVLAALGLQLLLRRDYRAAHAVRSRRPWASRLVPIAAVVLLAVVVVEALRAAGGPDAARSGVDPWAYAVVQLLLGAGLIAIAGGAILALQWARRSNGRAARVGQLLGVGALLALVVGQGLSYVQPYWPRVDRQTFYPQTDTHDFLAAHLGHDRYASTTSAMYMGLESPKRLRSLSGHTFLNAELAALLRAVPSDPVNQPTHVLFSPHLSTATSPILDRLGTRYFVTSPRDAIFGTRHLNTGGDGSVTLRPGMAARGRITTAGPLRAVGIVPRAPLATGDANARLDVVITDSDGAAVARGGRLLSGLAVGEPFWIPIAGEDIPTGTRLTVALTTRSSAGLRVDASGTRPRLSTVTAPHENGLPAGSLSRSQGRGAGDGVRLVYAGSAVVWERLHALPRIRWASTAQVEPDPARRVALLASGALGPDTVVLNAAPEPPSPAPEVDPASTPTPTLAGDEPARVWVDGDGMDAISVRVSAPADGYLVIADALQAGWTATVDNRPARLVAADQGVIAVPVAAGNHTVELRYAAPYHNVGGWLSLAAALLAAVLLITGWRRAPEMTDAADDPGELVHR